MVFVLRKKGSKTKKRMKGEEIEKEAIAGRQPEKSFFEILSNTPPDHPPGWSGGVSG